MAQEVWEADAGMRPGQWGRKLSCGGSLNFTGAQCETSSAGHINSIMPEANSSRRERWASAPSRCRAKLAAAIQ